MKCKHCNKIISFDDAAEHSCFVAQEVFMDNENNLFAENIILDKQRKHQFFLEISNFYY